MATVARGRNEPPPAPIIVVKKIVEAPHDAHHGGAWKIAYADFVTAMMAFFLLMWLVGATDENKKRGLADYFSPTLIEYKQGSAGSDGILNGDSIIAAENYPHKAAQTGRATLVLPRDATGGIREGAGTGQWQEIERFARLKQELERRIQQNPATRALAQQISFTQTEHGLRIDLVDRADFSMFEVGTDRLRAEAMQLIREVASAIRTVPNQIIVRGHTDSRPYGRGQVMNNWLLSTARAETTRTSLERSGVLIGRFSRIEGVADREPFVPQARMDPRNRRLAITLVASAPARAQQVADAAPRPPASAPSAAGPAPAPAH